MVEIYRCHSYRNDILTIIPVRRKISRAHDKPRFAALKIVAVWYQDVTLIEMTS